MDERKLAKLKARIGDEIFELLVGTRIDNVHMLDNTLLADKLQEIVNAINVREKIVDVDRKIESAKTDVESKANIYTDQQISLVTETGIPKLMVYPLFCTASEEGQTVFNIELDTFDVNTDTVFVQSGRTMLAPELDFSIVDNTIVLVEGVPVDRTITIYVFKNIPLGDDGSVSGRVIAPNSMSLNTLKTRQITLLASGWSEEYPFEQTIEIDDILAKDSLMVVGAVYANDATLEQVKAIDKAVGLLMFYEDGVQDGSVTFRAKKKPQVDITITTKGA